MSAAPEPAASALDADLARFRALWTGDSAPVARELDEDSAARSAFADFVVAHQLAVPLLRRLGSAAAAVPPPLRARCEQRAARQRERTCRLVALHARVDDGLSSHGVEALLLKGPPLARRLYGALDGRESVDLDLLVRPADAGRARVALAELGFVRRSRTLLGAALTSRFVHALDYAAGDDVIDLHTAVDRHPSLRLDPEAPWRSARREPLGEGWAAVPSEEIELLAIALGIVRDAERGRLKLKHLLDLRLGSERPGVASRLLAAARAQRAESPVARALALAAAALSGISAPPPEVAAAMASCGDVPTARDVLPWLVAGRPSRRSRGWSFRSWQAPPAANAAWWLVSLPFRLAVHGRARRARSPAAVR